jgi:CheY-like chemotaxis protein/HPt (histidine-containing phosphotransfer) domain-containing protein
LRLLREAAAAGRPFDLALVDLSLADTDGLDLAQRIHAEPALATTRVILLTPLGRRPDGEALSAAGVTACLFKPLRCERLCHALVETLEHRGHEGAPGEVAAVSATAAQDAAGEGAPCTLRVLLAEDNPVSQQVSLKQLRKLGFVADAVASGTEVVAAAQRHAYDIVLMDCQMPEMDGYEATRRIRQHEREHGRAGSAPAYIVALTANALAGDRDRCLEAGMDDYLAKPLQLANLRVAMQRALAKLTAATRAGADVPPVTLEHRPGPESSPVVPAAEAAESCLDPAILDGLRSLRQPGQPDPFRQLGELFLRDAQTRLQQMESALAASDAARLAAAAHALKGSASNLGARRLSALCAALERQGKAGDLTEGASALLNVTREFHAVETALVREMQGG